MWINSADSLTLLQSSKRSEYVKQDLNPEEVEDWIEERVSDPSQISCAGK
jgi:hypothetical protein